MVLDRALERRFLLLLLRNYILAVSIAIVGVCGSFVFLAFQMPLSSRMILTVIGTFSLGVMFAAEFVTFLRQSRPIRLVFQREQPSLEEIQTAFEFLRKFPVYGVLRVMGPHWLGLALPGLSLLYIAKQFHILQLTNTELFLELVASFCVASMHALLEFYLTIRACQGVLSHVNTYSKQTFGLDLSLRDDPVIHIRTMYTVSALLIGVLPLLLFTGVAQYHLVYQLHFPLGNMVQWAGMFVLAGVAFSLSGALLLSRTVELPVSQLQVAMREVAAGQLQIEVGNIYIDEFSSLVGGFNTMVRFLNERDTVNAQLLESFLTVLSTALDARDPNTAGHSVRVARYATEIACRCGMTQEQIDIVRNSAILHDIGKIGVRDYVLLKEDKLTDDEFAQIKLHPVIGEQILAQIEPREPMLPLLPGVRSHHERYDGNGYPDGLAGETIPLVGRLLAVADAFDAMTSDRPYRKGMSVAQAVSIIEDGAGSQWDPIFANEMVTWMQDVEDLGTLHSEQEVAVFTSPRERNVD